MNESEQVVDNLETIEGSSVENSTANQAIYQQVNGLKKLEGLKKLVIGLAVFQVISIIMLLVLMSQVNSLNLEVKTGAEKIGSQAAELSKQAGKLSQYDEQFKIVNLMSLNNSMALRMSEGVVTDSLVAQKVQIYGSWMTIDIRAQPTFEKYFKGHGRFDLPDRELKQAIIGLIDVVKLQYVETDYNTKIADVIIAITQNNYPVGEYEKGVLRLTGEN